VRSRPSVRLVVLLVSLVAAGCVTPGASFVRPNLGKIGVGMTKPEVISILGEPHEVARQGATEYFTYNFDHPFDGRAAIVESYFVRFVSDKVESFGRRGDFDSTKNPAVDINVNRKAPSATGQPCDLYTQLRKLEQLRTDRLLTDAEFETQRRKALEMCR
jgi:outer membrane protein assembly factor BamE (lipoprotein component of BamABCDE complex)